MFNIYWNIEQQSRKKTRIIGYYPLMLVLVGAFFYSIYCIFVGNYDTSTWILPYLLSVPFDTSKIGGWYLLWIVEANIAFTYSTCLIGLSSHFMSCCFYIGAVCDHFDFLIDLNKNQFEQHRDGENVSNYHRNYRKLEKNLCEAINIHNKMYA